jgi:hypothetical protein
MLTATRKQLSFVRGRALFAQVTLGRPGTGENQISPPEPEIILNDRFPKTLTDDDRGLIEAARAGIRQAELDLNWPGAQHYVLKIEGLEVDGIDAEAARLAAQNATKALIET